MDGIGRVLRPCVSVTGVATGAWSTWPSVRLAVELALSVPSEAV